MIKNILTVLFCIYLFYSCEKEKISDIKEVNVHNILPIYNNIDWNDNIEKIKAKNESLYLLNEYNSGDTCIISYTIPDVNYEYNSVVTYYIDKIVKNIRIELTSKYEKSYIPLYEEKLNELVLFFGNFDTNKIGINKDKKEFYGFPPPNLYENYSGNTYWYSEDKYYVRIQYRAINYKEIIIYIINPKNFNT